MPAAGEGLEKLEDMIVRAAETTAQNVRAATAAIGTVIFGQDKVIEQALVTILSGGHALLLGVPGLAKTKLVETLGIVLGLDARRIQFTPDLMPSDILGTEVLEESQTGKRSCCKRCRNSTSRSPARGTICRGHSMYWRHKTRSSRKAPIRCRKRSS